MVTVEPLSPFLPSARGSQLARFLMALRCDLIGREKVSQPGSSALPFASISHIEMSSFVEFTWTVGNVVSHCTIVTSHRDDSAL